MDFPLKNGWFSKVVKACQKAEVLREEAGQLGSSDRKGVAES